MKWASIVTYSLAENFVDKPLLASSALKRTKWLSMN